MTRLRDLIHGKRSRGVIVAGAPGVGKTRLAAECVTLAESAGYVTAHATATRAAGTLPLGALSPLLPAVSRGVNNRSDLLRTAADSLLSLSGDAPLMLIVDDAHLLDDVSAALLHQLAAATQVFVLATVRVDEPAPDAVTALWKDEVVDRLDLSGLPEDAVWDLLSSVLSGPVDQAAAVEFAFRSKGNALFLRELVLGALHDGALRDDGGIWRLVGPVAPSSRLVELVEARVRGLSPPELAVLELMSCTEILGPAELDALADPDAVESVERKGLLVSRENGRRLDYRLGHSLYGDVLRRRIPSIRARAVTRSLAEVMEATGLRRREDILRVATLRLASGGGNPDLFEEAAGIARWRYDFVLAERLARAAVGAGAGLDASVLAAQCAILQGEGDRVEADLVQLARAALADEQRGRIAITLMEHFLATGRHQEAQSVARKAEADISDPSWRDEIRAKRAWLAFGTEGPDATLQGAEPLLGSAEGRAYVWAAMVASYAFNRAGRLDEAIATASAGHRAHMEYLSHHGTPLEWHPWTFLLSRCEALTHAGRLAEAEDLALSEYRTALADRSPEAQAFFAWQLSLVYCVRGRLRTAAHHAHEAAALFRQLGQPLHERTSHSALARAAAFGGLHLEAATALDAIDSLEAPSAHASVDILRTRAWVGASAGDTTRATGFLVEAATLGEEIGDIVGAADALYDAARLGSAVTVTDWLTRLAARIDGPLVATQARHAVGLAADDPTELDQSAAAFDHLGATLYAAEAAADGAVAWRRNGRPKAALASELTASVFADRCENPSTPALRTSQVRAVLTRTEQAVALQTAHGRTNRQIASELQISVRTVESHLQHVYTKLGISSRDQLSALLAQVTR